MARSIWTGAISFGLVNVPVKLYSATEEKTVHFHQLERRSGKRIHNKRVAEGSNREVDYDDIVKGYEVHKGTLVVVEPDELEAVEPGRSRTIEIEDFINLDEIDPVYFNKTYYLGPASDAGAEKPYELLRAALEDAGKVGIARFVMRSKQYLATIRPAQGVLMLETMYFPDEVRPAKDIENKPKKVKLTPRERDIAAQLIESLSSPWDPSRYHDTYRAAVLDVIKRKAKGEELVFEEPPEEGKVIDLMAALEASVQQAKEGRSGRRAGRAGRSRPAAKSTRPGSTSGGTRGSKASGGARSKSVRKTKADYTAMTKEQLKDEAARHGISGRSSMTKDDLVDALRRAS